MQVPQPEQSQSNPLAQASSIAIRLAQAFGAALVAPFAFPGVLLTRPGPYGVRGIASFGNLALSLVFLGVAFWLGVLGFQPYGGDAFWPLLLLIALTGTLGGWQQVQHMRRKFRRTEPFSFAQGCEGWLFRWLPDNGLTPALTTIVGEPLVVLLVAVAVAPLSGLTSAVLALIASGMMLRAHLLEGLRYGVYLDRRDGQDINAVQSTDTSADIYEQAGRLEQPRDRPRPRN